MREKGLLLEVEAWLRALGLYYTPLMVVICGYLKDGRHIRLLWFVMGKVCYQRHGDHYSPGLFPI